MRTKKKRGAFSLVELMIVLAIIAALIALASAASFKLLESQQIANTQSTLDRTQAQLAKVWSQVKDKAYRESIPPATAQWIQTYLAGTDANSAGRVRVIYVKLRMRQTFPMNFTEALYPPSNGAGIVCPGLNPLPSYAAYLNQHGISQSSGFSWESSACLLMALTRGPNGVPPETLTAGGAGGVDDKGYGVPVLTDAWNRPIYFTRVPSGCPLLNPLGSHPDSSDKAPYPPSYDPADPNGYLQTVNWGTTYGPLFASITQQQMAPPNHSYKLTPMLASGGPSKANQPGFDPVTFAPAAGGGPIYSTP